MQFIKPGINLDFVGKWVFFTSLSAVGVVISLVLAIGGYFIDMPFSPKFGVDFAGGTELHLRVSKDVSIEQLRGGLKAVGLSGDSVQAFGASGREYLVRVESVNFGAADFFRSVETQLRADYGEATWTRFEWDPAQSVTMTARADRTIPAEEVQGKLSALNPKVRVEESKVEHDALVVSFPGLTDAVKDSLAGALGADQFEVVSVELVGASVGAELRRKAVLSVVLSLIIILVYVAFRFDLSFAPGAVLALFHDVMITVGVFCLIGREFTLPIVGALLTIIGYSINDTIVVYDRIRENLVANPTRDLAELINTSLNETLSRTLLTSLTVFFAVVALMIYGGPVIADFALALLIGVVVGCYSSVYIATPMILFLQRWLPVEVPRPPDEEPVGEPLLAQ